MNVTTEFNLGLPDQGEDTKTGDALDKILSGMTKWTPEVRR